MTESAAPNFGKMQWGTETVSLQGSPLPVLYFDASPCVSHLNGIIGISLTVTGYVPTETGGVSLAAAVVAMLKCNIPAALSLRDALNQALLLAAPVEKPEGQAH